MKARHAARGASFLLVVMASLAAAHGAGAPLPAWAAGVAAWGAGLLLWPRLDPRQKRQVGLLVAAGVAALAVAARFGAGQAWQAAFTQNNALLGMLVAVSFLHLVGLGEGREALPRGRLALWQTLFGVHLFGAVINLSVVFIMADRLHARGLRLQPEQAAVLVRGFLSAAMWSPFFAAVAVALTYAPGATLGGVLAAGLPFALALLLLAGRCLEREMGERLAEFVGFPMQFSALWLPLLLALAVGLAQHLLPGWSALAVVTVIAPLMAVSLALLRGGLQDTAQHLGEQMRARLPAMSGEVALFLAAAVFAAGLQGLLQAFGQGLPFTRFGALEASLVLGGMILAAMLGIHAVISIALVSAWLAPLSPDPLLLATVFTQSWAIGLAVGPMSGIHLALQGRYALSATALARNNAGYGLRAYALAVLWLFALAAWPRSGA